MGTGYGVGPNKRKEDIKMSKQKMEKTPVQKWMGDARNKLILVDIKRHMPGLRMTLSADAFGEVSPQSKALLDKYIRGNQFLLPKRYCNAFERADLGARIYLKSLSFETDFGSAIPLARFSLFEQNFVMQRARFMDTKTEVLENYDELFDEVMEDYRLLAIDMIKEPGPRQRFLDAIEEKIPEPEKIRRYSIEFRLAQLPSINFSKKVIVDMEEHAKTEAEKYAVEYYKENINEQLNKMAEDFFPAIYGQLAGSVKEKLESYKERIEKTGGIPKGMLVGLRNLVNEVIEMNRVVGDADLQKLVEQLNNKVLHRADDDDVGDIQKTLKKTLSYIADKEDAVEERDLGRFAFLAFE